jgi:serine O-acetyltransferase
MWIVTRLIYLRRHPQLHRLVKEALALYCVEVPAEVEIGPGLFVSHRAFGTVIHPRTTIGANVSLWQGVTIGEGDVWRRSTHMERIIIEDGAMLCAGAKILCSEGTLTVGRGTIVGANAVLTQSTGEREIWAGAPARKIRDRPDDG